MLLDTFEKRLLYELFDATTKTLRYEALRADLADAITPHECVLAVIKQVLRYKFTGKPKGMIDASDGVLYNLLSLIGQISQEKSDAPDASWRDLRKLRGRIERAIPGCANSLFGRAILSDIVSRAVELQHREVLEELHGQELLGWKDAQGCPFGQLVVEKGEVTLRVRPIGVLLPFIPGRHEVCADPNGMLWERDWANKTWKRVFKAQYREEHPWVTV